MGGAVPEVEVADHPHGPGIRCPDREGDPDDLALPGVVPADMGPEHLPELLVATLADQVQVHLAQGGQVAIGIVRRDDLPGVLHVDRVGRDLRAGQDRAPDAPVLMAHRHPSTVAHDGDGIGHRPQDADRDSAICRVRAEDVMGAVVHTIDHPIELGGRHRDGGGGRGGHGCLTRLATWATVPAPPSRT